MHTKQQTLDNSSRIPLSPRLSNPDHSASAGGSENTIPLDLEFMLTSPTIGSKSRLDIFTQKFLRLWLWALWRYFEDSRTAGG
jgi:hypothetical protein